mgnify:CR=1 FL=1
MIGINRVKSWVLIAALGGLFVLVGAAVGGRGGATTALVLALAFNLAMYWFSDKIAIASTRSRPVSEAEAPELYRIVRELAAEARMPMPRIYVSEMLQPNAFATGRGPGHAAVSVTRGILQILDERELRAVLAHELSHVANRDILVGSIAAAIGTAITFLARMAFWFGGARDDRDNAFGPFAFLIAWVLAPVAAALIQMAVSRSREYQADESGALLSRDPEALASALRELEHLGAGVQGAAPGHDRHARARVDEVGGLLQERRRRQGRRGSEQGLLQGGHARHRVVRRRPLLDVAGDGDVSHGPAAERELDRLVHDADDVVGPHHALAVGSDVHEQLVEGHVLLVVGADQVVPGVAGEGQHGLVVALGVVEAVGQVDAAGARCGQADAEPAGELSVATGGERGRLLVADLDEP